MDINPEKLRSIHHLALTTLAIVLILGFGFLWGEFKKASGLDVDEQNEKQVQVVVPQKPLSATALKGKTLFQTKCQRCHLLDRKMTGPGLAHVRDRWPDTTALYAWINNSQSVIASGNKYANELFKSYSNAIMPAFPELTEEDVYCILQYIDEASSTPRISFAQ
jgi:cytochrome c2